MQGQHFLRPRLQAGAVLLIGMIMLLMVTLIAVGVIRLTTRHMQVVNNEQVRTESVAAANYALDMVLNSPQSTWSVYSGTGQTNYVNIGTSATADSAAVATQVTVKSLACKRTRVIKKSELYTMVGGVNQVSATDASCITGDASDQTTIVDTSSSGSTSGDSYCATVLYEMQAQPSDAKLLNATTTVVQGVEVRTTVDKLSGC